MTPRRRRPGSDSSSGEGSSGSAAPARTRPDGIDVDADSIHTMGDRLDATQTRVDAVGSQVDSVDVGSGSFGAVGVAFAGSAKQHLSETRQQLARTRDSISRARDGTHRTAQGYRDTDAEVASQLGGIDSGVDVPRTSGGSTRPSGTTPGATTPAAAVPDSGRPDPASTSPADGPPASIGDRLDPPAPYRPSEAERALASRQILGMSPLDPGNHKNAAYRAQLDDGTSGVYKPLSEEDPNLRQGIPPYSGGYREVAASQLDEQLGFGLVPPTSMTDGHDGHGPGSMQQFVDHDDPLPHDSYAKPQQEQMAVLDYVMGNTDRHPRNYGTGMDGSPVAFDNGSSFPESPDPKFGIRSSFVTSHLGEALSPDVIERVRALDPDQVGGMLRQSGLSDVAVDGALARLREIQEHGMITGEAWPGLINDARLNMVRGPLS